MTSSPEGWGLTGARPAGLGTRGLEKQRGLEDQTETEKLKLRLACPHARAYKHLGTRPTHPPVVYIKGRVRAGLPHLVTACSLIVYLVELRGVVVLVCWP